MKKIFLLMLVFLQFIMSAGFGGSDSRTEYESGSQAAYPAYTAKDGTWAVYIYICGSDLESDDPESEKDVFGAASTDISEIVQVSLPKNVNVVMQTGGAKNWLNEIDPTVLTRLRHSSDGTFLVETVPSASMGDSKTLAEFLTFCNINYPAEHQAVILWDHGGGSLFGFASDENFDHDNMTLQEMKSAFAAAPAASGKYDIIGFDACLMATVDVADALKDFGRYLVASEELESAAGWHYTSALQALADNTSLSAEAFAKVICDTYYQELLNMNKLNSEINRYQTATLSVIDLSKAGLLTEAYTAMANEALLLAAEKKEEFIAQFDRAAKASENYGINTSESVFFEMADLGSLAENAAELLPKSSALVKAALAECVIYQVKGPLRPGANGVSCYYCYSGDPMSTALYLSTGGVKAAGYYHEYRLNGELTREAQQYLADIRSQQNMPAAAAARLGPTSELGLEDFPVSLSAEGYWQINIGSERVKSIAAVYNYVLLELSGTVHVIFGVGSEVRADWENGVFTESYSGMWGCIDNAQVFMQAAARGEGYIIYSAPVILNGIRKSLIVSYEYTASGGGQYTVLGVRDSSGSSEAGMTDKEQAPKDIAPLKEGDILEPLHMFMIREEDGSWREDMFAVQSITIGSSPSFYEKSLGDGHFKIMFSIVDYAGNTYLSEPGDLKVKEGVLERIEGWTEYEKPPGTVKGQHISRESNSYNPSAASPYYTAVLEVFDYTANKWNFGMPNPEFGDTMSGGKGGYTIEIFTNDPSINLGDFVSEEIVYLQGEFIDGNTSRQRDLAFEVKGIMTGTGGSSGPKAAGTLSGYWKNKKSLQTVTTDSAAAELSASVSARLKAGHSER